VASGGDPHYPLNIKMAGGEEVHGNSGSFRHFLSAIVEQLHGPTLNLLVPYRGPGNFTGTSSSSTVPVERIQDKDPDFLPTWISDPRSRIQQAVLQIRILVDPHHFGKLDPDPDSYQSGKLNPDPHQSEKQDPDLHQSENVEASESRPFWCSGRSISGKIYW
jgi:hypothetical protein